MNEKKLWAEGADAYRKGKSPEDNPFDFDSIEHFSAWQHGWRMEKQYWDAGISPCKSSHGNRARVKV